ncbi:hypothetical protein DFH27DRAFT_567285 [Peziza echinospora]|nr:hypothetical protein DFH27DRAFT_567285 [Peziza echinospora]
MGILFIVYCLSFYDAYEKSLRARLWEIIWDCSFFFCFSYLFFISLISEWLWYARSLGGFFLFFLCLYIIISHVAYIVATLVSFCFVFYIIGARERYKFYYYYSLHFYFELEI